VKAEERVHAAVVEEAEGTNLRSLDAVVPGIDEAANRRHPERLPTFW
jgi:hypothetical protein